ncbi:MAG: aldo/keto reductase [Gammaproteobacteria bacterium]|nr:aldo/keto reductase [Gammaproteobacteria bacterium]
MNRRQFISLAGLGLTPLPQLLRAAVSEDRLMRPIPSTGERIPAIGMGTWVTFNIGNDPVARAQLRDVLRAFFAHGGGMIDSSPMYGSAEAVLGQLLPQFGGETPGLFTATKVWTSGDGPSDIENSRRLWRVDGFDLLQVHNLLAWERHIETLFEMKERGELRYVGITTSHGRRHRDMLRVMRDWPLDFVQATYNVLDREVEREMLPLAAERGIAFIANRPYRRGSLINFVQRHPLPAWAADIDCPHWPAFLLKFIVSHPAVTCAIPATSQVEHMHENMSAMVGRMPDADTRERMAAHVAAL